MDRWIDVHIAIKNILIEYEYLPSASPEILARERGRFMMKTSWLECLVYCSVLLILAISQESSQIQFYCNCIVAIQFTIH